MFYIGCPLWSYKEWVGNFIPAHTPASDFLHIYSRKLNAVEGNTVFYALPSAETIARWRQETPETFRICPKISRSISHTGNLEMSKQEAFQLIERLNGLESRLGPMFLQMPPAFGPEHLPQLEAFLDFWPAGYRLAVEVRHHDFYKKQHADQLDSLLRQHQVARVMMDTRPIRVGSDEEKQILLARERKPNLPLHIAQTTDFIFLRYIGHPRMEVNEPFLAGWAEQLAQWLSQGISLSVFCHCPFTVYSPTLCRVLYHKVGELVPLPPLPWDEEDTDAEAQQPRLF